MDGIPTEWCINVGISYGVHQKQKISGCTNEEWGQVFETNTK